MTSQISLPSLRKIPLAYASCSIGCRPSDTLPRKLEAIADAGFTAIELSFPDLQAYACEILSRRVADDNYKDLGIAAREVRHQCNAVNLEIMMLQPFAHFEGWPRESVGSTDCAPEKISTRREDIVVDLRELATMLSKRNMRLAYENWCWSTHAPTWKDVWEIVKAVDRPNIGLCLDTFQTAGSEWGDPTTLSGLIETLPKKELEAKFVASLEELSRSIPPEKIYLLQISDAYKPVPPIENRVTIDGLMRPRSRWSHDFRPMPYAAGGYLPVENVVKAVLRTGFRGYFSMEIFDSGPDGRGKEYDMLDFAQQAQVNMQRLLENCATTD
ncbi:Xylose isomerase-like, TIM barrel-containing domain containing protein [Elaphomyces granulatus]